MARHGRFVWHAFAGRLRKGVGMWKMFLDFVAAIFKGKAHGTILGKFEEREKANEQIEVERDDDRYDKLNNSKRM